MQNHERAQNCSRFSNKRLSHHFANERYHSPTPSNVERAWAVNNSMAHEPHSMQEATERVIHILDANYEKADLRSVVSTNCSHLSLQDQNILELLKAFEKLFDGTLCDWKAKPSTFELKEGA